MSELFESLSSRKLTSVVAAKVNELRPDTSRNTIHYTLRGELEKTPTQRLIMKVAKDVLNEATTTSTTEAA